jgi:hypothetical protein
VITSPNGSDNIKNMHSQGDTRQSTKLTNTLILLQTCFSAVSLMGQKSSVCPLQDFLFILNLIFIGTV